MASATNLKNIIAMWKRYLEQSILYNIRNAELGVVLTIRHRFTLAQVNAGATVLPAIKGFRYRLVRAHLIAIGGAATTGTTVDLIGTLSAVARKLVAFGQAALTQSAYVSDGSAGGVILADGASYVANDDNTPISIGITGSAFTVATAFDLVLTYM